MVHRSARRSKGRERAPAPECEASKAARTRLPGASRRTHRRGRASPQGGLTELLCRRHAQLALGRLVQSTGQSDIAGGARRRPGSSQLPSKDALPWKQIPGQTWQATLTWIFQCVSKPNGNLNGKLPFPVMVTGNRRARKPSKILVETAPSGFGPGV